MVLVLVLVLVFLPVVLVPTEITAGLSAVLDSRTLVAGDRCRGLPQAVPAMVHLMMMMMTMILMMVMVMMMLLVMVMVIVMVIMVMMVVKLQTCDCILSQSTRARLSLL